MDPTLGQQPVQVVLQAVVRQKPNSRDPQQLLCPACQQTCQSRVVREPSEGAWIVGGLLFCFGCWPCCLIPCCLDECQNAKHYCGNCQQYLGTYEREL